MSSRLNRVGLFVFTLFLCIGLFQNCGGFAPTFSTSNLSSTLSGGGTLPAAVPTPAGFVSLSWAAPTNGATQTGFDIEQSTDNKTFVQVQQVSSPSLTTKVVGLTSGTYYFRVRAYNSAGTSAATSVVTAKVP